MNFNMENIISSNIAYFTRTATLGALATTGTIANGISLSFFVRNQKDSLADKHLIALNINDLLICILSPVAMVYANEFTKSNGVKHNIFAITLKAAYDIPTLLIGNIFNLLGLLSCSITAILSVTRTLALTKPFHMIQKRSVYLIHCINTLFLLILFCCKLALYTMEHSKIEKLDEEAPGNSIVFYMITQVEYTFVLLTVGIVAVSSVLAVRSLHKPPENLTQQTGQLQHRQATATILTLSVTFVITNSTWCVFWAVYTAILKTEGISTIDFSIMRMLGLYVTIYMVTINSIANPVIYIVKNSGLNDYTKNLLGGLKRLLISSVVSSANFYHRARLTQ